MTWVNYDDAIAQLKSIGLIEPKKGWLVDTVKPVRCDWSDSTEPLRGWFHLATYQIDGDAYVVGAYGYWQGDDNNKFKIELIKKCKSCGHENSIKNKTCEKCGEKTFASKELSKEQKDAMAKQRLAAIKQAEALENARQESIADLATKAWYKLSKEGDCGYLQRKGVEKYHGFRYGTGETITLDITDHNGEPAVVVVPNDKDSLIIPVQDHKNKIWGLQIIRNKPEKYQLQKEFWPKGCKLGGNFYSIGHSKQEVELVAEGLATAMTLYQATDKQYKVHVAFNANNIVHVAPNIKKANPRAKLLFCADDDYLVTCKAKLDDDKQCNYVSPAGTEVCPACNNLIKNKGKAGERAAQDAALAVQGAWVKPHFEQDRGGKKLTDFNDLANFPNCSLSTVTVQINDKLTHLGWVSAPASAGRTAQGGGGDAKGTLKPLLDVSEAVERYSLIYGAGGTMYDHQEASLIPKSDVLDICVDHAWREWKLHPERSVVRLSEVGFDPTERDGHIVCNLWGGWPTTPKAGQCETLLSLLRHLCSGEEKGNDAIYQWVLKWLAYPIQHQGAKMRTALIFHGPQGAGKNLFFEAYAAIFGKYARIIGQAEIDDKFNDWASGKLFMIADEVVARQELFHIKNKIKALITGETIRINPKNVAAHDERNHVNLVFLSNEKQPLVLEQDDRRFAVIWTPHKLGENYYSDVAEEVANGGIEALHDYLLHLDLGDFNEHSKPPMTQSKEDLININLESSERFMREWLGGELDLPVCPVLSEDLYSAYKKWCDRNGVVRPRELNQLIGGIVKMAGWKREKPRIWDNLNFSGQQKQRAVMCPPDEITSEKQKKTANLTLSQWFTSCVIDFGNALRGEINDF